MTTMTYNAQNATLPTPGYRLPMITKALRSAINVTIQGRKGMGNSTASIIEGILLQEVCPL